MSHQRVEHREHRIAHSDVRRSMNGGIPVDCTFEWDEGPVGTRFGRMLVNVSSLDEYRGVVSRLVIGTVMVDQQRGRGQRMRIADPDQRPPRTFPARAILNVIEEPLRDGDPRYRMRFANNFLHATGGSAWVDVIEFVPPSKDGQEGRIVVVCKVPDTYAELRRFVDEPHGSMLDPSDGRPPLFVNRISDTGSNDRLFPQVVTVTLRWLRLE